MKRIILVALAVASVSCSSVKEQNEDCIEAMPVEVRQHVKDFLFDAKRNGKRINLKRLRVELCEHIELPGIGAANGAYFTKSHLIKIDTSGRRWKVAGKALMYHELGHALLKLEHSEDKESIMYYTSVLDLTEQNVDELFR